MYKHHDCHSRTFAVYYKLAFSIQLSVFSFQYSVRLVVDLRRPEPAYGPNRGGESEATACPEFIPTSAAAERDRMPCALCVEPCASCVEPTVSASSFRTPL
jgi:hypothetical protein